jgi:hypothetical protein
MVAIPNAPKLGDMPKGEPLPEALYHLRVDKVEFKKTGPNSKKPGSPMAEVQLTVFGPAEVEEFHGRKVFENFMLSGEGMFRTRQFLEAAGAAEDFVLEDTDQLLGMEVGAVVQVEPSRRDPETGQEYSARNKVQRYLPLA